MELVVCPECSQPAEARWRTRLSSTDAPVEHVRVDCLDRHWFLMPSTQLVAWPDMPATVVIPVRDSRPGTSAS
jgi:hypothetical protein